MAIAGVKGVVFFLGRVFFGGVLAFTSGAFLVVGGLSVVLGMFPFLGATLVAGFLVVSVVLMHDLSTVPEKQRQDETTAFLKNTAMAGGALVVAAVAGETWAFSVGLGLGFL